MRDWQHESHKKEEGDFKGTVRLASSENTLPPVKQATPEVLRRKHSPPHPDSTIPPVEESPQNISISEKEVAQAI